LPNVFRGAPDFAFRFHPDYALNFVLLWWPHLSFEAFFHRAEAPEIGLGLPKA